MMQCPKCGADGRVMHVQEEGPDSAVVTYVCPNSRCNEYRREIGTERIDRTQI